MLELQGRQHRQLRSAKIGKEGQVEGWQGNTTRATPPMQITDGGQFNTRAVKGR